MCVFAAGDKISLELEKLFNEATRIEEDLHVVVNMNVRPGIRYNIDAQTAYVSEMFDRHKLRYFFVGESNASDCKIEDSGYRDADLVLKSVTESRYSTQKTSFNLKPKLLSEYRVDQALQELAIFPPDQHENMKECWNPAPVYLIPRDQLDAALLACCFVNRKVSDPVSRAVIIAAPRLHTEGLTLEEFSRLVLPPQSRSEIQQWAAGLPLPALLASAVERAASMPTAPGPRDPTLQALAASGAAGADVVGREFASQVALPETPGSSRILRHCPAILALRRGPTLALGLPASQLCKPPVHLL
jgi:hypothetical protein